MEEGSTIKGKKRASTSADEEVFAHFQVDAILDDDAVRYRFGGTARVYQPEWGLMEYESITAFTRSAMKFVEHCLPEPDRRWAREMDAKTLRAHLARIHCNDLALSTELGRRYFEVSDLLSESDLEVERLKADIAHWKDVAGERGVMLDSEHDKPSSSREKDEKIKSLSAENQSQATEIEDLRQRLEEATLMAGKELLATYSMRWGDFRDKMLEDPGVDVAEVEPTYASVFGSSEQAAKALAAAEKLSVVSPEEDLEVMDEEP